MSLDIQWQWLAFDALSRDQLYELLRLRSEVFVVEQNCVFQDMDNLDQQAMHLLGVRVAAGSAPCPPPALRAPPLPAQNPLPPELPGEFVGQVKTELIAYVRCFPAGVTFNEASIGRVVTKPDARGGGLGHLLMAAAVKALEGEWGPQPIRIGAQAHLKAFYEQHGFVDVGKPYIEDGIPHLEMLRGA
ncbi:MAG: GNAT family N-acetyltransferase [Betaproteobacteria bacterium]|nr:GNAT family N-acetyltransferase [Betaproteobacteria bacterium]